MDKNLKSAKYVESGDYIPKEIRKKLKLGEYADQATDRKKTPAKVIKNKKK